MSAPRPRDRKSPPPPAPAAPLPSLLRDAWLLAVLLAPLVTLVAARGAPLGLPFADDFDFLDHARFGPHSWLDGGGGALYWRPLARQAYYALLGPVMLSHPAWITALHALALAAAGALAYAALRERLGRGPAAFAAAFPATLEGARSVLAWPSGAQELGAWLCLALALFAAHRRALAGSLVAAAAALLCKETAAAAVPLLALLPPARSARERGTWLGAHAALLVAWAAAHRAVEAHAGQLPLSSVAPASLAGPLERGVWALAHAALDTVGAALLPTGARLAVVAAAVALIGAGVFVALRRSATERDRGAWLAWGAAWFVLTALPAAALHPDWSSYRSLLPSFGLGVALAAAMRSSGAWLAALAALRLVALLASPTPPAMVAADQAGSASAVDFPRVARLQRFTAETRALLQGAHPVLPHGAVVVTGNMPHSILYTFAGRRALRVWYADSTLRFVPSSEFAARPDLPAAAALQFQPDTRPQLVLLSVDALRAQQQGTASVQAGRCDEALAWFARADSLQRDTSAVVFRADDAGGRAFALQLLGRRAEAAAEAARALALLPVQPNALSVVAAQAIEDARWTDAERAIDALAVALPDAPLAATLRRHLDEARAAAGR